MNRKKAVVWGGIVVTIGLVLLLFINRGSEPAGDGTPGVQIKGRAAVEKPRGRSATQAPSSARAKALPVDKKTNGSVADGNASDSTSGKIEVTTANAEDSAVELAEQARARWDSVVNSIAADKTTSGIAEGERLKQAFEELDPEDKLFAITQALNLFPDEQFTTLYPVLFDKGQPKEILDAIFSDALNRAEEIKLPLMRELRKDKTHPMYFDSARILDVID